MLNTLKSSWCSTNHLYLQKVELMSSITVTLDIFTINWTYWGFLKFIETFFQNVYFMEYLFNSHSRIYLNCKWQRVAIDLCIRIILSSKYFKQFSCITTYHSFNLVLMIFWSNSPSNVQNSSNNSPLKEVSFSGDL